MNTSKFYFQVDHKLVSVQMRDNGPPIILVENHRDRGGFSERPEYLDIIQYGSDFTSGCNYDVRELSEVEFKARAIGDRI